MPIEDNPGPNVSLMILPLEVMKALLDDDLQMASTLMGVALPPFYMTQKWLWRYRVDQIERDPATAPWLVHAVVVQPEQVVVGHAGFHGPPDERGMVEIGYSILPEHQKKGYGRAAAAALIRKASSAPGVRVVRASISPENAASLALIRPFGFAHVGEQWDEEDGQELIFELPLREFATTEG